MTDSSDLRGWLPDDIDINKPNGARVYDFLLGGAHNFQVDRDFAEKIIERVPRIAEYARINREFLGRAVRYAAKAGIRQFVDIGCGLPAVGAVHDIADRGRSQRDATVVYVDKEPIAVAHAELMLQSCGDPSRHAVVRADLLEAQGLWDKVCRTKMIDVTQPIALLVVAVLHFVKDGADPTPDEAMAFYREVLPPGSLLVLSTMTNEKPQSLDEEVRLRDLVGFYEETSTPGQLRTSDEFVRFFGDWPLWPPGLTYATAWRPDRFGEALFKTSAESRILVGIAEKPGMTHAGADVEYASTPSSGSGPVAG